MVDRGIIHAISRQFKFDDQKSDIVEGVISSHERRLGRELSYDEALLTLGSDGRFPKINDHLKRLAFGEISILETFEEQGLSPKGTAFEAKRKIIIGSRPRDGD